MAKLTVLPYSEAIKQAKQATIEVYDALNCKNISIKGVIIPNVKIDCLYIPFSASSKYFYHLRHNIDNETLITSIAEYDAFIDFYGMFITDIQLPFYPSCDLDELEIISYKINN